jgi:hypothetical protein
LLHGASVSSPGRGICSVTDVNDANPPRPPLSGGDRLRVPSPPRTVTFTRSNGRVMTFTSRVARAKMDRPDQSTGHGKTGIVGGCTPEAFASLLEDLRAELASARPVDRDRMLNRMMRPQAFEGKPWVWQVVTLAEAADLTGLAVTYLRRCSKPSDRVPGRRAYAQRLPPPLGRLPAEGWPRTPPNVYSAAEIVLWRAARRPTRPKTERRRAPARVTKDQRLWSQTSARRQFAVLAFLRALIREDTAIGPQKAVEMVTAAGIDAAGLDLRMAYAQARRAEAGTFITRLQDGSVHPDGLVTLREIAKVYGVPHPSVASALNRGDIVAAKRDGYRILVDPSRLRMREEVGWQGTMALKKGLGRVPVDMDRPDALPLP